MKKKIVTAILMSMVISTAAAGSGVSAAAAQTPGVVAEDEDSAVPDDVDETGPGERGASAVKPEGRRGQKDGRAPHGKPDGQGGPADGQTPPEMPDGQGGFGDGQTPPEMPDGQGGPGNGQTPPEMPGGMSGEADQGTAASTITEDGEVSGETYTSEGDDENALRVEGAKVSLEGITVNKSAGASSNVGNGDFYGTNAGLLATDGAEVTITEADITTSAQNGNGVFSYGQGTVVSISDSVITTSADNSGGIQTTGGGTTNAENLTVETTGNSSAAIRSDRGGGTVNVSGGSYTSSGFNSPAIYSTAAVSVSDAELTANSSEAVVIEGKNSVSLENCAVSGNMSDDRGSSSSINVHNVMIYQSMSGDAEEGTSSFSMTGGTMTCENGDMFYVTNTACEILLENVSFVRNDEEANFMTVTGNDASRGWGTAGSNGGNASVVCTDQTVEGNIVVDTVSSLNITFAGTSEFTGAVNIVENAEGGEACENNAVVTLGEGSVWNLTGGSVITSLEGEGTVNYNGYTITLADGTVLS